MIIFIINYFQLLCSRNGDEPFYLEMLREGLLKLEEGDRAGLAIVVCGADP